MPSPRSRALTLTLAVALALPARADPTAGWEQTGSSDGVTVFRREVPGSPFHGIKGTGMVDAPPATVALVLLDDARAPEWVDSLVEARVVNVLSAEEYLEYNRVEMPWPVRDREFLTRVRMRVDAATRQVEIRSEPADHPALPPRKGTLRGTLRAVYLLEPVDGGARTRLTVEIHSDPGGWLPAWLVNFFQKDWARETIAGIRKQAGKPDLEPPEEFRAWLATLAGLR